VVGALAYGQPSGLSRESISAAAAIP
jgi:hypothetical protein